MRIGRRHFNILPHACARTRLVNTEGPRRAKADRCLRNAAAGSGAPGSWARPRLERSHASHFPQRRHDHRLDPFTPGRQPSAALSWTRASRCWAPNGRVARIGGSAGGPLEPRAQDPARDPVGAAYPMRRPRSRLSVRTQHDLAAVVFLALEQLITAARLSERKLMTDVRSGKVDRDRP